MACVFRWRLHTRWEQDRTGRYHHSLQWRSDWTWHGTECRKVILDDSGLFCGSDRQRSNPTSMWQDRIHSHSIPQHENYDIWEMREYFCTTFCSFVTQLCAALYCIYFTYAILTEVQTLGTNFAIVQKVDFIINTIEWCYCDLGQIVWFTMSKCRTTNLVMGKDPTKTRCGFRHSGKLTLGTEQLLQISLKRVGSLAW